MISGSYCSTVVVKILGPRPSNFSVGDYYVEVEANAGTPSVRTTYSVLYLSNGADNCRMSESVKAGAKFKVKDGVTRTGKKFAGWYCNGALYQPGDEFTMPAKDVYFVAAWEGYGHLTDGGDGDEIYDLTSGKYYVIFDANGAEGTMPRIGVPWALVFNLPESRFKAPSGRRFAGWRCSNGRRYDDGVLAYNLASPGKFVTLTAIWE